MLLLALLSGSSLAASVALQFAGILVLGAGSATDAYFAAQTLPMILSAIFSGALINNLTPLLAGLGMGRESALVRAVMMQVALILLVAIFLLSLTARWWTALLFSGLDGVAASQVGVLVPIMCVTFGMTILTSAGIAGHYARGNFLRVEVLQLAMSLAALAIVTPVTDRFGVIGFASLLLLRAFVTFLIAGSTYLLAAPAQVIDLTRTLWVRMAQILTGSVIFKLGPVVDRSLASLAMPGVLTSIGMGQQIAGSCASVTERVLSRPLLVAVGARANSDDRLQILDLYRRQLRIVGWGAIVALLGVVPLTFVVAENRSFAALLGSLGRLDILLLVTLTAIPAAASQLSSSLMYAIGEQRKVSRLAMLSFFASTTIKVAGYFVFGVYAVIAGIFLYQALNWALLHVAAARALRVASISMHDVVKTERLL